MAGAAAAPFILPGRSYGQIANSDTIKIGLIGCGGRGSGAARNCLSSDKNVMITAMADVFPDRLQSSLNGLKADKEIGEKMKVEPQNCFSGLDAYKKLIDSDVDLVILATPPGFRPAHLQAAVAAGKHVFCEKPMAVDAPGVRSVLKSVEEAKKKNTALVAGFCWRYHYPKRETFKRIHGGQIGDIRAAYATYNTGTLSTKYTGKRQPMWGDLEWQLRNWYNFCWLSGDHLVEQAVHSVDKLAWAMKDKPPVSCVAHGGRQIPSFGNIYDHFSIVYDYDDGAKGFLFCRQQDGCANDNSDTYFGTKGTCRISGRGEEITGEKNWRYSGPKNDMYQTEHDELVASIRAGKPINDGVWMTHSTLLAIMGRMAAYTGKVITWEQAMNSQEELMPENMEWDATIPVPPTPMPGKTKFI